MTIYQEHQNLPVLPDIPGDLSLEQQEFFARVKELLEVICGRRGEAPAIPQFQMGEYTGNGSLSSRTIAVNFRPRYVKVFIHPASTDVGAGSENERIMEYIDDPEQSINWAGFNYWHYDSGSYHLVKDDTVGIVGCTEDGFLVFASVSGLSHPNKEAVTYNWLAFG